ANNNPGTFSVGENQFINLTFNSQVDEQQLPLVAYSVDWGDNEGTSVSGVEMRDRQNLSTPHSLYHLYSYWDLRSKRAVDQTTTGGVNSVYCGNAGAAAFNFSGAASGVNCPVTNNCCMARPRIMLKDNWGWCNGGTFINDCDQYTNFGGWIVVREE
ncbi:MAG: hypothetical protein ABIA02_03335, partial [Candidatus Falkowbacteria bacterium]